MPSMQLDCGCNQFAIVPGMLTDVNVFICDFFPFKWLFSVLCTLRLQRGNCSERLPLSQLVLCFTFVTWAAFY